MKHFHGSNEPLTPGPLTGSERVWVAFDGAPVLRPFWVSPSKQFARLNGRFVYECSVRIASERIFGDRPYTVGGRYWEDMAANEGRLLYEALRRGALFGDAGDFEEIFRCIVREDYDVIETAEFIGWAMRSGFSAAYVQGDGVRNLVVFNASDVVIERLVEETVI